jgi:hypothetical protein
MTAMTTGKKIHFPTRLAATDLAASPAEKQPEARRPPRPYQRLSAIIVFRISKAIITEARKTGLTSGRS